MIIECIDKPNARIEVGQRFLVLDVEINLNKQKAFYNILYTDEIYSCENVSLDSFKVVCDKMPSNWVFEYKEDATHSKKINLAPKKWLDDNLWTFGFWEALYCYGDTGYEELSSEEEEKARQVFLEESRKIYEECGKGWVPNPFE